MRTGTKYFCGICVMITVFVLGNFICYKSAMKHFEELQVSHDKEVYDKFESYVSGEIDAKYEEIIQMQEQEDDVSVGKNENSILGVETVFQIESYDSVKDTTVVEYKTLPEELVGGDRDAADEYCKAYMRDVPAEEFLKGISSMGVVSYSGERLVVRKVYDSSKVVYRYYLIAIDGEVVVYYGDKKTDYEYTGIETSNLTGAERRALKKGIEVTDEDELYSILENYSS